MTNGVKHSRRRAIGIVRVSQVNGREGERFASPGEQQDRIEVLCEREGLRLLDVIPELDTSGGAALDRRRGLRKAVEQIEAGRADVLVVAYFDRLVRSLRVQTEVLERVERAGGQVLAADVGQVSNETAARWLSSTMLGMVAEYVRRTTAERTAGAQRRAVEQGRPPFPLIDGLKRVDEHVEIDPDTSPAVIEAVRMRAGGATIAAIREHLRAQGVERSYHGTQSLLCSTLLYGEVRFGDLRGSVPALVDRDLWDRAQRVSVPRGRRAKSDRLLARLGVLRCGTCGGRMVVGTANHGRWSLYRCSPTSDCTRRVTIGAEIAERVVIDHTRALLAGVRGSARGDDTALIASRALDRAQADLDAAVRGFAAAGLDGEATAVERLAELRQARDQARDEHDEITAAETATAIAIDAGDWDDLTRDEQRDLIVALIERVTVAPGRGDDRLMVHPRAEALA